MAAGQREESGHVMLAEKRPFNSFRSSAPVAQATQKGKEWKATKNNTASLRTEDDCINTRTTGRRFFATVQNLTPGAAPYQLVANGQPFESRGRIVCAPLKSEGSRSVSGFQSSRFCRLAVRLFGDENLAAS